MVSLAFNIGAADFKGSTALKRHLAGNKTGASAAFALWRKIRDRQTGRLVDSPGLGTTRSAPSSAASNPPKKGGS